MRRIGVLAAGLLVVVAGCGGGSDAEDRSNPAAGPSPAVTTTAAPKDYTIDELTAALPSKDDVPGVIKVDSRCPDDGEDECGAATQSPERVEVSFDLATPVVGSAVESEARAQRATITDAIYVTVTRYGSAEAATTAIDTSRTSMAEFDGTIDSGEEPTSFGLREKGTGMLDALDLTGWSGFVASRTTTITNEDETQQIQNTLLTVRSGRVIVAANVVVDVTGRPSDYAARLARETVAGYIERLA